MNNWQINTIYDDSSSLVDQILDSRGIPEKELFLNPPNLTYWANNIDVNFLRALKLAKKIVEESIKSDLTIIIHGDYDADGICATAILYNCIKNELGHDKTYWFVPNRFEHGYGLSNDSIDSILKKIEGEALFITVDSGITSVNEVTRLKELGHRVIITDHHQKPAKLPDADAIVWYDKIVGASIAWFVAKALGSKDAQSIAFAALATVTDLQPLLDLNRSIVKIGLDVIKANSPLGLKTLIEMADKQVSEVSTYDLGWTIGPRINATGRIEDAGVAVDLLLAQDVETAQKASIVLNTLNSERQEKTSVMYEKAQAFDVDNLPLILVVKDDDFHEGVIGLVASKLVQKYYRPSIVISTEGDIAKASVRSIQGVNIIEFLRRFNELFLSLGGHPMAAGFSIEKSKLPELEENLSKYAAEVVTAELLTPVLEVDIQVPIAVASIDTIKALDQMEPFGLGNRQPLFMSAGLRITNFNVVGRESSHLQIRLVDEANNFYKCIMFGGGARVSELNLGDLVEIVYSLKENVYKGKSYVDLVLKDFKVM